MGLRQLCQHLAVANVETLHKESLEQGVQQGFVLLRVLLRGVGQQLVRTPGVGKHGDAFVVDRQTGAGRCGLHLCAACTHRLGAAEAVFVEGLVRPALRWRLRDQLHRMPAQLNLHARLALGQLAACGVQVRFADPAPGADQVEVDVDLYRGNWHGRHQATLRRKPWLPPLRLGEKPLAASDSSTVS